MAPKPNAPSFCLGPPEISKLWTLVAQIDLSGNSKLMGNSANGHLLKGSSLCQKWVGYIKKSSFFFHLNHQFLGRITQLTTYFDAFSQLYILHC